MTQAQNKTQPTDQTVSSFLNSVKDEQQRQDSETLVKLMQEITGEPPKMWGPSIVGFGQYHYKYASGREGDYLTVGFSPRKTSLTLYFVEGTSMHPELLARLGPYKVGKACLYIKRLSDINMDVLRQLIQDSYTYIMQHKNDMHRAQ